MSRPHRRTWAQRAMARERALVQFALADPRRPLRMHRRAALWLGCRLMWCRLVVEGRIAPF